MDPWYGNCSDGFFTAFDPPRTLEIAPVMLADATTTHAVATTLKALPSPSQDWGARKTTSNEISAKSTLVQKMAQADKTTDLVSGHEIQLAPQQTTQAKGAEQNGNYSTPPNGDPGQQCGDNGNPQQWPEPTTAEDKTLTDQPLPAFDPDRVLPNQMSQIESALAPSPQNQPTMTQGHGVSPDLTSSQVGGQYAVAAASPVDGDFAEQVSKAEYGSETINLPAPALMIATTIAGHAIRPISDGVLIHDSMVTAGAAAVTRSSLPVSMDQSNHMYLGGTSYELPTPNVAPMTLLDGAVAVVPLPKGVVVQGTTLLAGGPPLAVSGAAIALDSSDNLVFHGSLPAATLSVDQAIAAKSKIVESSSNGIVTPDMASTVGLPTTSFSLSSSSVLTTSKSAPSVSQISELSTGTDVITTSEGLGSLILGGLGTGGPQKSSSTGAVNSTKQVLTGNASPAKSRSPVWKWTSHMVTLLMFLHL